jgi:hypothetical protein
MSDTGLAPQYVTRCSAVLASKSVYHFAVYDSAAWQRMSIPADAVTSGGRVMVSAGSMIAMVGRSRQ